MVSVDLRARASPLARRLHDLQSLGQAEIGGRVDPGGGMRRPTACCEKYCEPTP